MVQGDDNQAPMPVLAKLLLLISVLSGFLLVIITCIDVFMRNTLGSGINGAVQMIEMLMVVTIFCAMPAAQHDDRHVTLDFGEGGESRIQQFRKGFSFVIYIAFCGTFAWLASTGALAAYHSNKTLWMGSYLLIEWPFRSAIAVGMIVMTYVTVQQTIRWWGRKVRNAS